ncbi:hypothetical protein F5Y14DRAFT_421778 [Nemania sp. NC0429]|nr:hypothetical protein F5Y14DRAFT_421778 [Nemania sp. NC0429]
MHEVVKTRLLDALDGIEVRDTFAGGYDSEEIRDIRITVKDVGNIKLPLSQDQAQQIISKTRPINLVKIEQTDNDTVTRNAWELDLRDVTITRGAQWDGLLKDILKTVSEKLGITHPIQMHQYRMLLFGKGIMFKEKAAIENTPNTFGTLVMSLPSRHRRGDVAVKGRDTKQRMRSSQRAVTYTFWSSDVEYNVLPVKSGYRWVLVCNLATTIPLERPLLSGPRVGNELLRKNLEHLTRDDNERPVYYALDYHYADNGLSLAGLLPRDRACVEQLLSAGQDLGFDIFLAILETTEVVDTASHDRSGDGYQHNHYRDPLEGVDTDYDSDDSVSNFVCTLLGAQAVFELNGTMATSSLKIHPFSILQDDPFGNYADIKQGLRNYDSQVTHWYRTTALVIVPPKGLLSFFTPRGSPLWRNRSKDPWHCFLDYCIGRCQSAYSEAALKLLLQLLEKMSAAGQLQWHTCTALSENLYHLAISINSSKLIDWMVLHGPPLPLTVLSSSRTQFEMSTISFECLSARLSRVFETKNSLNDQYQTILAIHGDIDPNDELLELLRSIAAKAISNWGPIGLYEDGIALLDLTLYTNHNFEVMKSSIIPKLVNTSSHLTAFMFGFIHKWKQCMRRNQVPPDEAKPIYEELVRATIRDMSISSSRETSISWARPKRKPISINETLDKSATHMMITHQILHDFTVSLFQPGLEEQRDIFIKKIGAEARSMKHMTFNYLWIPLLQDLLSACEKLKISLSTRTWQQLYQAVLKSFLLIYVGKPPQPDLAQTVVSCPCSHCRELDKFLADPTQKVTQLRPTKSEIPHILYELAMLGNRTKRRVSEGGRCVTITKDVKSNAERLIHLYEERKLDAARQLCAFDQRKLRTVLAGEYEAIMTMSVLERPEDTALTSPLASIPETPAKEIARLEAEMERLVNATPSSAPALAMGNSTAFRQSTNKTPASQTMSRSRAEKPSRTSTLPHATTSSASRAIPAAMHPAISPYQATRGPISSTPITTTPQRLPAQHTPKASFPIFNNMAASRSVSSPSRLPPSTTISHPVAGAKRKMVECIDLTLDDD